MWQQCRKGVWEIPNKFQYKLRIHNALTAQRILEMAGNVDSELLLKFIVYFREYLSALSHTLLLYFWTTFVETAVFICYYYCVVVVLFTLAQPVIQLSL